MHYLQGAFIFDAVVNKIDEYTASKIVWLDSLIINVDRTARNTNMLMWHNELWLIDHGASLYFQHNLTNAKEQAKRPFPAIKDHVPVIWMFTVPAVDKDPGRFADFMKLVSQPPNYELKYRHAIISIKYVKQKQRK